MKLHVVGISMCLGAVVSTAVGTALAQGAPETPRKFERQADERERRIRLDAVCGHFRELSRPRVPARRRGGLEWLCGPGGGAPQAKIEHYTCSRGNAVISGDCSNNLWDQIWYGVPKCTNEEIWCAFAGGDMHYHAD
jgi:hypothetical protein